MRSFRLYNLKKIVILLQKEKKAGRTLQCGTAGKKYYLLFS